MMESKGGAIRRSKIVHWARARLAVCVASAILAADVVGILMPRFASMRDLQVEIDELAARRAVLHSPGSPQLELVVVSGVGGSKALKAHEVVPEISLLGRRT